MSGPRDYAFENGYLPVADLAASGAYDDAVEAFRAGGSRSELLQALMTIGVPADIARWHAAYPGNRMSTMTICDDVGQDVG